MTEIQERFTFMVLFFLCAGSAHLMGRGYYLVGVIIILLFVSLLFGLPFIRKYLSAKKTMAVCILPFWLLFFITAYLHLQEEIARGAFLVLHYGGIIIYAVIIGISLHRYTKHLSDQNA